MKEVTENGQVYICSDSYPVMPCIKYLKDRGAWAMTTDRQLWLRMTEQERTNLMGYDGVGKELVQIFLFEIQTFSPMKKTNPRLVGYFQKMENAGIIANGRAAQILA